MQIYYIHRLLPAPHFRETASMEQICWGQRLVDTCRQVGPVMVRSRSWVPWVYELSQRLDSLRVSYFLDLSVRFFPTGRGKKIRFKLLKARLQGLDMLHLTMCLEVPFPCALADVALRWVWNWPFAKHWWACDGVAIKGDLVVHHSVHHETLTEAKNSNK